MSLLKSVVYGSGITIFASGLSTLFSLLTAFILLNNLKLDQYGLFALILSAVSVGSTIMDLGIRNVVISDAAKELSKNNLGGVKSILFNYGKLEILVSVILAVILFFAYILADFSGYKLGLHNALTASAALIFYGLLNIYASFFYSYSRFTHYAFLQIAMSLIELLATFYLLVVLGYGLFGALLAYSGALLLGLLISLPLLFNPLKELIQAKVEGPNLFANILTTHGKYSIMTTAFIKPIADYLPIWLLQLLLGVKAVAIYSAAFKLYQVLLLFFTSIETILLPTYASIEQRGKKEMMRVYARIIKYTSTFSILLTISAIFLAPILIPYFFPQYTDSIIAFQILSFSIITYGLSTGQRSILFAYQAQKYFFLSFVFTLITTLLLGYATTFLYGVIGMAITYTLVLFTATLLRYFYLASIDKELTFSIKDISTFDEYDYNLFERIKNKLMSLF